MNNFCDFEYAPIVKVAYNDENIIFQDLCSTYVAIQRGTNFFGELAFLHPEASFFQSCCRGAMPQ